MSAEALHVPRRRSRLGLYAPFALLALFALVWSAGWFVIRERTRSGLDEWIAAEAEAGRRWSCADRSFGGFPFRIEIRCSDFTVDRPDVHLSMGPLTVVAQVYRPRHIIAEASGPLRLDAGPTTASGRWKLLEASVVLKERGFERLSLVVDEPVVSVNDPGFGPFETASRRFEAHLRPDPGKPSAYDLALLSRGAAIPGLDMLVGGTEAADFDISLVVTEADDLPARPLWTELERWRLAKGQVELVRLGMAKGTRRLEAKGAFGIDDLHRPEGQIDASAAGLGGLLGRVGGGSGLLGMILGGGRERDVPPAAGAPLKPLPPLRLSGGRLFLGPLQIPGVRVPALY